MRASFHLTLALTLPACGGRLSSQPGGPPDSGGGDVAAGASTDAGPNQQGFDASGLPTALAIDCGGSAPPIGLKLPSLVCPHPPVTAPACFAVAEPSRH